MSTATLHLVNPGAPTAGQAGAPQPVNSPPAIMVMGAMAGLLTKYQASALDARDNNSIKQGLIKLFGMMSPDDKERINENFKPTGFVEFVSDSNPGAAWADGVGDILINSAQTTFLSTPGAVGGGGTASRVYDAQYEHLRKNPLPPPPKPKLPMKDIAALRRHLAGQEQKREVGVRAQKKEEHERRAQGFRVVKGYVAHVGEPPRNIWAKQQHSARMGSHWIEVPEASVPAEVREYLLTWNGAGRKGRIRGCGCKTTGCNRGGAAKLSKEFLDKVREHFRH